MGLNKLAQVSELRSKDFDTTNRFHFRTSADTEDRITRSKPNDCDIGRVGMNQEGQRAQNRVNIAIRNPTVTEPIHKNTDVWIRLGPIVPHQGQPRSIFGKDYAAWRGPVQPRPECLRWRQSDTGNGY